VYVLHSRTRYVSPATLTVFRTRLTTQSRQSLRMGLRDSLKAVVKPKRHKPVNEPTPPSTASNPSISSPPPPVQRPPVKLLKPAPQKPRITPEEIRKLRDLIRYRYALDIQIWEKRGNTEYQRRVVNEKMKRADAALADIRRYLTDWDNAEYFERPEEYQKFQEIKRRIETGNKRNWRDQPPWLRIENGSDPFQGPFEKDSQPLTLRGR
jgi:hypothetical protein